MPQTNLPGLETRISLDLCTLGDCWCPTILVLGCRELTRKYVACIREVFRKTGNIVLRLVFYRVKRKRIDEYRHKISCFFYGRKFMRLGSIFKRIAFDEKKLLGISFVPIIYIFLIYTTFCIEKSKCDIVLHRKSIIMYPTNI